MNRAETMRKDDLNIVIRHAHSKVCLRIPPEDIREKFEDVKKEDMMTYD